MSVFIGSTTPSQRACLSKEFKKLYAKKTFIPRKQKIAIALNTCDVGIKGVKETRVVTIEKWFVNDNKYFYWIIDSKTKEPIDGFSKKYQALDAINRWGYNRQNKQIKIKR